MGQLKGRFRVVEKQVDIETCKVDNILSSHVAHFTIFCLQEKEIFLDEWWPTKDKDNESKVLNDNWGFDVDTAQNLFFFTIFTVMVIEFLYALTSAKGARVRMRGLVLTLRLFR